MRARRPDAAITGGEAIDVTQPGIGPVRVAIAGTGWGVRGHIPVYSTLPGAQVVAVWSRSEERAEQAAQTHGIERSFGSFQAMLEDMQPDLVSIAVPPAAVAELARQAIDSGANLLMERCRSASEVVKLIELADARGVAVAVDLEYRFMDAYLTAGELLADGAIGEVRHILHREAAWWRASPDQTFSWWYSTEEGGGALAAMGVHVIDVLRSFVGDLKWVQGTTHSFNHERMARNGARNAVTGDDVAFFTAQAADSDIIANVVLTAASPIARQSTTLIEGSRGWVSVEMPDKVFVGDASGPPRRVPLYSADLPPTTLESHWQVALWRLVRLLIEGGGASPPVPIPTLFDLAISLQITEAIRESAHTGTRLLLPESPMRGRVEYHS